MAPTLLGFDKELDRTAAETRRQAPLRLAIAALLFATGLTAIPLPALGLWLAMFVVGDGVLWIATDPRNQARAPAPFRAVRLAASHLSTWAWVTISGLWWFSASPHGQAIAVALLGGVLLYVVRGCHRSMAQMLATGVPPLLGLIALPFTEPDLAAAAGLFTGVGLLALYSVSSGLNAWRAHRALERATRDLLAKQREAEAASVAKSAFLANMSHEIRTPLNGVLAMAHILARADLGPQEQEAARLICTSGEVLERLVSEILDLAKVESGQLQLESAPFHAGETVRTVAALCRPRAEEKGVALVVEVAEAADRTWLGDGLRVRQILNNLLSNAVKFTREGEVRLSLDLGPQGQLRFAVADTGVGFDAASKARLFERFQQADDSITRSFGGSGLGLAICRGLADAMDGLLDCDSVPGQGSTFRFEVSLPPVEPTRSEDPAEPVAAEPAPTRDRPLRVLAADDHPANRKVVEIILVGAGVEVTSVENGRDAVAAQTDPGFDLVLMDMQMPVMDGLAAVAEIRRLEAEAGRPRTPIVMLTANGLQEHVEAGRRAGADGHLTKPVTPAALLQAIAEALPAAAGPARAEAEVA